MTALPLLSAQSYVRLWTEWMLATLAAGIVFLIISIPINSLVLFLNYGPESGARPGSVPFVLVLLSLFVTGLMGAVFGLAQWLVLRRYLHGVGWWVLATAVGYAIPFSGLVGKLLPDWGRLSGLLLMLTVGVLIGLAQWLVLRGKLRDAYWWAVITVAAWAFAFGLTGLLYLLQVYVEPMDLLFAFLLPPAAQGLTLAYLLQRTGRYA